MITLGRKTRLWGVEGEEIWSYISDWSSLPRTGLLWFIPECPGASCVHRSGLWKVFRFYGAITADLILGGGIWLEVVVTGCVTWKIPAPFPAPSFPLCFLTASVPPLLALPCWPGLNLEDYGPKMGNRIFLPMNWECGYHVPGMKEMTEPKVLMWDGLGEPVHFDVGTGPSRQKP